MDCEQLTELALDAPVQPRPPGIAVPLIALQRLLWDSLVRQGAPLNTRVCAASARIQGPLDLSALERSVEFVRHRHESLRTRVITVDGSPIQHVDPPRDYHLEVVDLSTLCLDDALRIANGSAQEFLDQKLDISIGPMFASKVWKLRDGDHIFVAALDHMVSDGASYAILNKEIWTVYGQYAERKPLQLPALPVQFPDFAVWQHRTSTDWKRRHEPYWKHHMSRVQCARYPWSTESRTASPMLEARHVAMGHSMSVRLRTFADSEQVELYLLVLSIYAIVMARWCDRDDLIVRHIHHGRQRHPELKNMIGFIVNWITLRIRIDKHSFQELLMQLKREVADALDHLDYNRVPSLIPECQTELEFHWQHNYRTLRTKCRPESAKLQLTMKPFKLRAPNWCPRFWPVFFDTPSGIIVTIYFQPEAVAPSIVEKFGANLRLVANEYLERPLALVRSVWMKIL